MPTIEFSKRNNTNYHFEKRKKKNAHKAAFSNLQNKLQKEKGGKKKKRIEEGAFYYAHWAPNSSPSGLHHVNEGDSRERNKRQGILPTVIIYVLYPNLKFILTCVLYHN